MMECKRIEFIQSQSKQLAVKAVCKGADKTDIGGVADTSLLRIHDIDRLRYYNIDLPLGRHQELDAKTLCVAKADVAAPAAAPSSDNAKASGDTSMGSHFHGHSITQAAADSRNSARRQHQQPQHQQQLPFFSASTTFHLPSSTQRMEEEGVLCA